MWRQRQQYRRYAIGVASDWFASIPFKGASVAACGADAAAVRPIATTDAAKSGTRRMFISVFLYNVH
jgi:hypothetical protein